MPKRKWVSFFLCLFLGYLGIHKFYEGRVLLGILYLCTGGILGIGVIIDLIILRVYESFSVKVEIKGLLW